MMTNQKHSGSGDSIGGDKHEHHHYSKSYKAEPPKGIGLDSPKIQVANLPHTSGKLLGRQNELGILDTALANPKTNTLVFQALGGTGKTALLKAWLDKLAFDEYPNLNAVFTWSFYSQGAAEDKQADATPFFDAALDWFGYSGDPIKSDHEKGIKLSELINHQRSLLILDGLEPLQHPVGLMRGVLKDKGLQALLNQLAAKNQGLCVISSRQIVVEIENKPLVVTHKLEQLQTSDGIELIKSKNVNGSPQELKKAIEDVHGHALTLNLLGSYLSLVYEGDIRQRDKIPGLLNDELDEGEHAEKVMAAYEQHLEGQPELVILYWLGLFDSPASEQSLRELRQAGIEGFSQFKDNNTKWSVAIDRLQKQQLINRNKDFKKTDNLVKTVDTHPLIREYFAKRFKSQYPDSYRQAHLALYKFYKAIPDKKSPKNIEEMNHLFSAVSHGCAAGLHQEVLSNIYWIRIQRKSEFYSTNKLGAFNTDLAVLSNFFSQPWITPVVELSDFWRASILNWAAFRLRALGRLEEAVSPTQVSLKMLIKQKSWGNAALQASNLSELQLTQGKIKEARSISKQSVNLSKKSNNLSMRIIAESTLADAHHQAGFRSDAERCFKIAERIQLKNEPDHPLLFSVQGVRYCDLLLFMGQHSLVIKRSNQSIEIARQNHRLLDIALDELSLGRANLQEYCFKQIKKNTDSIANFLQWDRLQLPPDIAIIKHETNNKSFTNEQNIENLLKQSVHDLRKAGTEEFLVRGLLIQASCIRHLNQIEMTKAEQILKETYNITQRSGMKLLLTDYHLESTRLSLTTNNQVHNKTAQQHLDKAIKLIKQTGYHRRNGEVSYLKGLLKQ